MEVKKRKHPIAKSGDVNFGAAYAYIDSYARCLDLPLPLHSRPYEMK